MKTPEDYFFIGLILLEEFVRRILISPIKLLVMYDQWSHNRLVAKAAKEAEENPPVLPESPFDND
jgi:hypothetical protein|tara:strand:- start:35 stop:229 length:195 start_codon:yes stop_codon:yes gene_type:complete